VDRTTRERLAALARLAAVKKDADLAQLALVSGRLEVRLQARRDLQADLARQAALAAGHPDMSALRTVDAYALFAERMLSTIEADIARISAAREAQRSVCARSFGRAQVLDRLREGAGAAPAGAG
jgi:hypothetical protein